MLGLLGEDGPQLSTLFSISSLVAMLPSQHKDMTHVQCLVDTGVKVPSLLAAFWDNSGEASSFKTITVGMADVVTETISQSLLRLLLPFLL